MNPLDPQVPVDRMPAHMGVIWGAEQGVPLVYTVVDDINSDGKRTGREIIESVRELGGPFLDMTDATMTPALLMQIWADRGPTPAVPA